LKGSHAGGLPLVFFQGGYGRFSPRSLVVDTLGVVTDQLRWVDAARPEMERLADSLPARCIATVRVKDELVIAASAGRSTHGTTPTLVGQRLPFMPPTGSVLAAWSDKADVAAWLLAASNGSQRKSFEDSLQAVRSRGYSIGLVNDAQRAFVSTLERLAADRGVTHPVDLREQIQNLRYDPASMSPEVEQDVRLISAPVFGPQSEPLLALTIYDFPKPQPGLGIRHYVYSVLETTTRLTEQLGGVPPSL
jgi:DNA-binding IclR family transcriptional regulator